MRLSPTPCWMAFVFAVSAITVSCQRHSVEPADEVSRVKVNLPESPPLKVLEVKRKHADGIWTVAGLRAAGDERFFGETVKVRGVVLDRHLCPKRRRRNDPPCDPLPHLLLGDSLEDPRAPLLVAGTTDQIAAHPESGETVIEGVHVQWSQDRFFVDSRGLLQLPVPTEEGEN